MHRYCTNCGNPVEHDLAFCVRCGAWLAPPTTPAPVGPPPLPPPASAPTTPPSSPRRRRRLTAALLAAVVLLAGGGVTAYVLVGDSDEDDSSAVSGGREEQVEVSPVSLGSGLSLRGEPGHEWTFLAETLLPDAYLGTLSSHTEAASDGESLVLDDVVVVDLVQEYPSEENLVVGLDAETGEVLWQDPELSSPCFAAGGDGAVCRAGAGKVVLVDAVTGKARGSADLDSPFAAAAHDSAVFVMSAGPATENYDDHSVRLTRFSTADLAVEWSEVLEDDMSHSDQGNDFDGGGRIELLGGEVRSDFGYLRWVNDEQSGELLSYFGGGEESLPQSGGYSIDGLDNHTRVTDDQGNTILSVDGSAWYGADGPVLDGRIGIGPRVYDLSTGKVLWERPELDELDEYGNTPPWNWLDHGRFAAVGSFGDDGSTLLNGDTGETVWASDDAVGEYGTLFIGDAVVIVSEGELVTHMLDGSDTEWRRPISGVTSEPDDWALPRAARRSLVVSSTNGVLGFSDFTRDTSEDDGQTDGPTADPDFTTACGSEPVFEPVTAEDANGGLTLTVEVHAECPSGQWLDSTSTKVRIEGPGGAAYAGGSFDFSEAPRWVPGPDEDPATLELVFPYGTTYSTSGEVRDGIERHVVVVPCETDDDAARGTVPADPAYAEDDGPAYAAGPADDTTSTGESALAALRRIAQADSRSVDAELAGRWMPQLSSKQEGTTDDGIVYRYPDILAEHLRLRARYPDARLVFSSEWKSYQRGGYWVTLVGSPTARWQPAVRWCVDQGFDRDHCYGKRISREGPWDGNTKNVEELP